MMNIGKKEIINPYNWELMAIRSLKFVIQCFPSEKTNGKSVLFIMGCQRSGTSLIYWLFERDLRTKIYREASRLSLKDPKRLRLDPLHVVRKKLESVKVPLQVLKPLVESQNASRLLKQIPNSRILWMYRRYSDVIASNLRAFGEYNGFNDIKIMLDNSKRNWRSEKQTKEVIGLIKKYFHPSMNPNDAAALFWFARNKLLFSQNLVDNSKVMLCRYEDLGAAPNIVMKAVYRFLQIPYPGDRITRSVHAKSVGKGVKIRLSEEIEERCAVLLEQLDSIPKYYDAGH
jgi:hypothetical protein